MNKLPSEVRPCLFCLGVASLLLAWGCAKPPTDVKTKTKSVSTDSTNVQTAIPTNTVIPNENAEGTELPQQDLTFRSRYQSATGYRERATLRLSRLLEDGKRDDRLTYIDTVFARPNRIQCRIQSDADRVAITSDGKRISAKITDPVTENFQNQVVIRDAKPKLSISQLYQVTEIIDPISPEEIFSTLLGLPASLDVLPISLIVGEGKLDELASSKTPHRLIGSKQLPNKSGNTSVTCQVIEARAAEGGYRFWIAEDTIRRIEFPALVDNQPPGVRQTDLVVDFDDVSFSVGDEKFQIDDQGTQVRHFVFPPIPLASQQLGERIGRLRFQNRDGKEVEVANGDKQVSVLIWFNAKQESRMVLDTIEQIRRRNRSDRVRFAAIASESNATAPMLTDWKIETAWLNDKDALGRDFLSIKHAPTTVVLGPNNTLQYFEVGVHPNLGNDVASVCERLLAGHEVASDTKARAGQMRSSYQQLLSRAKLGDGWVEELDAKIPPASQPKQLKLTELWKSKDVDEPGNILVVPGKRREVLVTQGWKQVAILTSAGKLQRTIELDLPDDEGISILRAATDGKGRALLACATRGGRHAYVFDFGGKLVTQYPPVRTRELAVSDIAVHDIDKDDDPELIIGWQGNGGIHSVGLDGKRRWSNMVTPGVISLAAVEDKNAGSKRRPILIASESGLLFLVDGSGKTLREIRLSRVAHQLITWPGPARGFEAFMKRDQSPSIGDKSMAQHIGIATSATGRREIVGVNSEWEVVWTYVMPGGVYRHQVDFPQTFEIAEIGKCWILPGADGAIHILSADGKFQDQFNTGAHIRGIAGGVVAGKSVLLLSTDEGVTAMNVESNH